MKYKNKTRSTTKKFINNVSIRISDEHAIWKVPAFRYNFDPLELEQLPHYSHRKSKRDIRVSLHMTRTPRKLPLFRTPHSMKRIIPRDMKREKLLSVIKSPTSNWTIPKSPVHVSPSEINQLDTAPSPQGIRAICMAREREKGVYI